MSRSTPTITWEGGLDGACLLIDQTLLPTRLEVLRVEDAATMWDAIKRLAIRGAPAIGVAAAFGAVLGIRSSGAKTSKELLADLDATVDYLASSRPTAINLFWALRRMQQRAREMGDLPVSNMKERLLGEAMAILEEDRRICKELGVVGSELVSPGDRLMTHCNAGGLATAEYGTALAVMFEAHEQGKNVSVYVPETRPLLQGARLTAWELMSAGIDTTLITDSMTAHVMRKRGVDRIFVGADRIARNGDTANKIGTYALALHARTHGVPFYVVAPVSTFDLSTPTGDEIPIEERDPKEVTEGFGLRTAPEGVRVYAPAFDVTPAELIRGIVTERGLIAPVSTETVVAMVS